MEIIRDFYKDKDHERFLRRCVESAIQYRIVESNENKIVYQIGLYKPIAQVAYSHAIQEVSVIWFTCNI